MAKKFKNNNVANNGGKWIRRNRRLAIYERDNFRCVYCGKGIEDEIILNLDHIVPQELGGTNASTNLVTCCKSCNCQKGHKTTRQFFSYLRGLGVDTDKIGRKIRNRTRRQLRGNFRI